MNRKFCALACLVCLLLSGCSWLGGSYVNVTPHQEQSRGASSQNLSAANYGELVAVLEEMVNEAAETGVIFISNLAAEDTREYMEAARKHIRDTYPLGAYAVEDLTYEIGTSGGIRAVAVEIHYQRSYIEIQKVSRAASMEEAEALIGEALDSYAAGAVVWIGEYTQTDFTQLVQDYAETNPHKVMEIPGVAWETYGSGTARVVELTFTYENSRDDLREMQAQVQPVFDAAALYVSGPGTDYLKFSQLYSFLMRRFNYELETSITPTYSLLQHGVGDSRSFAVVYAAMCRLAGLECQVVTGTRDGDPWSWNIVKDSGRYYHVDLQLSARIGRYWEYYDGDMVGYVWDYSDYPACAPLYNPKDEDEKDKDEKPEETDPEETKPEEPNPSEPTAPEETTEPTEPTIPWWPSEPTEPTEPTDPTEPSWPIWPWPPEEPTEPSEPTDPTEPTAPTEPTEPIVPGESTEPTEPTASEETTQPVETTIPWWPTEPEETTEAPETVPTDTTAPAEETEEPTEIFL
ncbi:MAG: transglutaminase domain-containing protein [Oscillospiraceae bacterium]|nr:transglutaminase domain-containing protein [Oscillospiraceae bacterium]